MAYMDANAVFASGIQELSFDEIEQVDGGIVQFLVAGAVILGGVAIGYGAAYLLNRYCIP